MKIEILVTVIILIVLLSLNDVVAEEKSIKSYYGYGCDYANLDVPYKDLSPYKELNLCETNELNYYIYTFVIIILISTIVFQKKKIEGLK